MSLTKKLASLILAMLLVFTMSIAVFAADETGSITINGVGTEHVYSIYKLLDLESYNVDTGAYSCKVNKDWTGFFATEDALEHVAIDDAGYVTWIAAEDDATVAKFAKLALAYAEANGITPVQSSENDGQFVITDTAGKFTGLELGYYLVDSTMGALCGLTTTNPNAFINTKNGVPTIDKQVQEDLTQQWGASNTADIGQIVDYRVTINVHAGAQNYVLHDVMDAGLTFKGVTKIEQFISSDNTTSDLAEGTDYTVKTEDIGHDIIPDDHKDVPNVNCTFEVHFSEDFCASLETNDKIVVHYQAMLNRNAVIAGDGNVNDATLEFGEDHFTTHDTVTTKTFGFDLVKTDSQNTLIDGAEFKIYDAETGGNEVAVVLMDDGVTYRRARTDETGIPIVVKNGQVRVQGFDNGTYYLEETIAPTGYNKLTSRTRFIISDSNLDAIFKDEVFSTGSGVHVVNKTGSMFPETGGIGRTIFYIAGSSLVIGAVVLLITKKRMSING